jgi:hypothetical protein
MAKKKEETSWVFRVLKRTENGLQLTDQGIDKPDVETILVETTGRTRQATGMGPKRGWNEVVVTTDDDVGKIGWFPWNSKPSNCWIIWDLGSYGPPNAD